MADHIHPCRSTTHSNSILIFRGFVCRYALIC